MSPFWILTSSNFDDVIQKKTTDAIAGMCK